MSTTTIPTATRPAPIRLVLSWLLVAIPLGWGVYESVKKSLPLFLASPTAAKPAR